MLSFFSKKKIIHENNVNDPPIPGPVEQQNNDDFIFVERKSNDIPRYPLGPAPPPPTSASMYPAMPGSNYGSNGLPYGQSIKPKDTDTGYVPYVQGVPFVLAPQLASESQNSGQSSEVDHILAIITRQMSVDEEMNNYNFNLEKSVLNGMQ